MGSIIKNIRDAAKKTPNGVSFVSIKGYENSKGELADILLNIGVSYEKAIEKDVETLKELDTSKVDISGKDFDKAELETARNELLARMIAPSKQTQNRSKGQSDAYETIVPGVRLHKDSGAVFVFGQLVKKDVRQKGDYGEDRRKSLTKAKDHIRKHFLRSSQFRQYKVLEDKAESLTASGDTVQHA